MDLALIGLAFGTIFVVELPDKTFIAALVLATRYSPLAVWVGVGAAFAVQTVIGVLAGQVATLLPRTLIEALALVIFLVGGILLIRSAPGADEEEHQREEEYEAREYDPRTGLRAVLTCFLVLFAAEWGDLSQLLTISLVAKYGQPLSVFVGAWGALLVVSGLAVIVGRYLMQHVRLSLVHYVGGIVCLVLAGVTGLEILG